MIEQKAVVAALLHNERCEVLLQHRDDKPGLPYASFWTFFGGAVEPGETPDEAVRRELLEELALENPLRFWKAYTCPARSIPGTRIVTNHVYTGELARPLETLTLYEGQGMRFYSEAESHSLQLAFMQSPILEEFFMEFCR